MDQKSFLRKSEVYDIIYMYCVRNFFLPYENTFYSEGECNLRIYDEKKKEFKIGEILLLCSYVRI